MSPKNGTTIGLTTTLESYPMSVDNNNDELVIVISTIENPKPSPQPADYEN